MGILDLFSKRQRRLTEEISDVLDYTLSQKFRNQLLQIVFEQITEQEILILARQLMLKEHGRFFLQSNRATALEDIAEFISRGEVEQVLDFIETIMEATRRYNSNTRFGGVYLDEFLEEVNGRLKENGIGFAIENFQIIRVDSTYIHSEVVKPTLHLLGNSKFIGANEEYINAHEHYKVGRNKECLAECLKAFESTLKIICNEKGWKYDKQKDAAKKLIHICVENGLLPGYIETQINTFRGLLESGVPVIRNKNSGHGQGNEIITVDDSMARYGLNLTGSNIIFVIEQSKIQ